MKRRTWIAVGGGLLLVCFAVGWYRLATRPEYIKVSFEGYQASTSSGGKWMAVFRATNGTSTSVSCSPGFGQNIGGRILELPTFVILEPKSGMTWLCPVPDTNSVRQLEIQCFAHNSRQKQRLVDWIKRHWTNHPRYYVLMVPGYTYWVTCSIEAR